MTGRQVHKFRFENVAQVKHSDDAYKELGLKG